MSWTLADMRTKWRALTGRSSTSEVANAVVDAYLNDAYRYDLCQELDLDRFDQEWTAAMAVTDDGEYSVSEDVIKVEPPMVCNDEELVIFEDKTSFYLNYPSQEDWHTPPTLAIGTDDTTKVKNSAFTYDVSGWTYSHAGTETTLSGDTVPQNKYGAWQLEIDADGDITVQAASGNDAGYDTPGKAVNGLPPRGSGRTIMGFVTAISTDAAGFVPGTTALDDAAVTDTYTDGDPGLRGLPEAVLINRSEGKVFVRPKPNDAYTLKSHASLQRPTALSADADTPHDEAWGLAISIIAAINWLISKEASQERIAELTYGVNPAEPTRGSLNFELNRIRRKQSMQMAHRAVERSF